MAYSINLREIIDLMQAFNKQSLYEPSHMLQWIDNHFKKRILELWEDQVHFNQRIMLHLIREFETLNYYDEEIFMKLVTSINSKNKIQNLYFFDDFYNFMHKVNENPKYTLYGKLDNEIKAFEEKHYTKDFQWRYNCEERRMRTHKELVARREEPQPEDFIVVQLKDERSEREKKRIEAAQQLKNAVYNEELFIKVVQKMMDEGKTLIEMMVYLDVTEQQLQDAFSKISQQKQVMELERLKSEKKDVKEKTK